MSIMSKNADIKKESKKKADQDHEGKEGRKEIQER